MEFTFNQWKELKEHCDGVGLEFMSTPSCLAAVVLLEKVGVKRYKIGSGDITNLLMLRKVAKTGKPIILSSGMSTIKEIMQAGNYIEQFENQYSILHCTSKYPTKPEDIRLDLIKIFKSKFNCPVGFSDHSGTIYPSLAASALGAEIIEFHAVFDKKMFGPDSLSSLTIDDIRTVVKGIRYIEKANNSSKTNNLDKDFQKMKTIFNKSLSANKFLKKGHKIAYEDLESKKPSGMGIPASRFQDVLDKRLNNDKDKYDFLNYEDLEK